jgi:hypothetical protein
MEECEADPVAHERAYRKLFAEYGQAYLEGRVPQSLRSVTDDEVRAIAGEVLTREQLLLLGLEEPRQLTPQEYDARKAEMRRQKEYLFRQAGTTSAGQA